MIDVSPFTATLQSKPVAVFGLGASNLAVIKVLRAAGITVIAGDDKPDRLAQAAALGAETSATFADQDFSRVACLVLAPGIPLTFHPHPVVTKAKAAGIEILCDIEILHRCAHGRKTVGITGTNGKSTTTALTGHILRGTGIDCMVGGNIGVPVFDLDLPAQDGVIVLELSSFQIDLCPTFVPDIAVHLNLAVDHLDRHGDMMGYANAKLRMQRGSGQTVIGVDDEWSRRIVARIEHEGKRQVYKISVGDTVARGVTVQNSILTDVMQGRARHDFPLNIPALGGAHNQQNAAAAYAVACLLGLEPDAIYQAMKTFPGLVHRQFLVRIIDNVAYINDSKATNADAAARALDCAHDIYWIAGGRAKDGGLDGMDSYMGQIRHAFLIGEAAESFAVWLKERHVPCTVSQTLDRAVADAHAMAQPAGKGTVLLSPACASYDQFRNFEERGEAFTKLVETLQ